MSLSSTNLFQVSFVMTVVSDNFRIWGYRGTFSRARGNLETFPARQDARQAVAVATAKTEIEINGTGRKCSKINEHA